MTTAASTNLDVVEDRSVVLNVTTALCVLTAFTIFLPHSPSSQIVGTIGLIALPGYVGADFFRSERLSIGCRLLISGAIGLTFFYVYGLAVALIPQLFGVQRPLDGWFIKFSWLAVLVALCAYSLAAGFDPVRAGLQGLSRKKVAWAAALAVPPLVSLVAVNMLNLDGSAQLAVVVALIAIAMVVAAIAVAGRDVGPPTILILASATLTFLWQQPMRGGWMAGWDISHEIFVATQTVNAGRFPIPGANNPYQGMLSLTVLPAQLQSIFGLQLRTFFVILPSIALVGVVAAMWYTLRYLLPPRLSAALVAIVLIGSQSFETVLTGVTRQCWALFFFAMLIFLLVTFPRPSARVRILAVALGFGMAASHYSTALIAAGAIIAAWLVMEIVRYPNKSRLLDRYVAASIIAITLLWESLIAHIGSNISDVANAINDYGFQILPGSGNLLSRWIAGADINGTETVAQLRRADHTLRRTSLSWMKVTPQADHVNLRPDATPVAHGVPILGALASALQNLIAQGLLLLIIVSVIFLAWRSFRTKSGAAVVGMAIFALILSAVSRVSQTLGVQIGPTRIEVQAYMIFVVAIALAIAGTNKRPVLHGQATRNGLIAVSYLVVIVALLSGLFLTNFVEAQAALPLSYDSHGLLAERTITPIDLIAANWFVGHVGGHYLQSDRYGQVALFAYGGAQNPRLIPSLDPIIVDNNSWLFLDHENVLLGRAQGGTNAASAVYQAPVTYYEATRDVLYASNADAVFGIFIETEPTSSAK